MKTWIKRTLIGVFSASVLAGGLAACGGHRMHGGGIAAMTDADYGQMRGRLVERAGKELQLDDAQKQRLVVLADKLREQRNALVGTTTNPRAELQALVAGTTFDRTRAQGLVESKTGALRAKSPEVIAAAADFYDSLKPEQQQRVRDFMNRSGRRGWGRQG